MNIGNINNYIGKGVRSLPTLDRDLVGTELLYVSGPGDYSLPLHFVKKYVQKDIHHTLRINNVDNTPDYNKPLSVPQKAYIDSSISKLSLATNPRIDHVSKHKADLINGSVPVTQLPMNLRLDGNITVSMSDIQLGIDASINNVEKKIERDIAQAIIQYTSIEDPHHIKPYVDACITQSTKDTDNKLSKKVDEASFYTLLEFIVNAKTLDELRANVKDLLP